MPEIDRFSRLDARSESEAQISATTLRAGFVDMHRPVIMRGALRGQWPAVDAWDDAYLAETIGFLRLPVETSADQFDGRVFDDAAPVVMPFAEFLRRLYQPEGETDYFVVETPPPLWADIPTLPMFAAFKRLYRRRMLMTRGGNRIALHWDWHENLLCQVAGRKSVFLVDVTDTDNLYPLGRGHADRGEDRFAGFGYRNYSAVDIQSPDHRRHPLVARATIYRADLDPGDILYIPCFWWHAVASFGRNIAISVGFYESDEQLVQVHRKWLTGANLPRRVSAELRCILASPEPARTTLLALRRAVARYDLFDTLGLYTYHRRKLLRAQVAADQGAAAAAGDRP